MTETAFWEFSQISSCRKIVLKSLRKWMRLLAWVDRYMMMMMMIWWWIAIAQWLTKRSCLHLFSSRDHIQRFSSSQTSNNPRAGFESAQNLTSSFVVWSWVILITSTPLHHLKLANAFRRIYFADFVSTNLKSF